MKVSSSLADTMKLAPRTLRALSFAAAALVASTGCAPTQPIPGFDSSLVCNLDDCSRWTPELVGERLQDWQDRWVVLLDETPPAPATITIDAWGPGTGPGGYRAWNTDDIHVAAEFEGRPLEVWESSLAHEATHSALWVLTGGRHGGDGDRNHAVGDGPWTPTHDVLIFTATREPQ